MELPPTPTKLSALNREHISGCISKPSKPPRKSRQAIINTIEATWASIRGEPLPYSTRTESWPYHVVQDLALIPASLSDYRALGRHIELTYAKRARFCFDKSSQFPGLAQRSAIVVKIPPSPLHNNVASQVEFDLRLFFNKSLYQYHDQKVRFRYPADRGIKLKKPDKTRLLIMPDHCIVANDSDLPFLVIEVAVSETEEYLLEKGRQYVDGGRGHISVILMLKVHPKPHYQIDLWVWKVSRLQNPTENRPEGFDLTYKEVLRKVRLHPRTELGHEQFDISLKDIFQHDDVLDNSQSYPYELNHLARLLEDAIEYQRRIDAKAAQNIPSSSPNSASDPEVADEEAGLSSQESQSSEGSLWTPDRHDHDIIPPSSIVTRSMSRGT